VAGWSPSGRDSIVRVCRRNVASMSSRPRKPSNANPCAAASRAWRALLIRRKGQVLGDVDAPSREAAEAEAVRTFNLSPEQRSRLVVQGAGLIVTRTSLRFGTPCRISLRF
jgi:hypothetical protein